MIARLPEVPPKCDPPTAVGSGVGQHVEELRPCDVITAARGEHESARRQQSESTQIDFLVAAQRGADGRTILGKRGRVQHDGVEPLASPLPLASDSRTRRLRRT